MATDYRCYFLNGERIVAVEGIACDDDAAALLEADRILAASRYRSIEIWAGPRRVAIISREDPTPETQEATRVPSASSLRRRLEG
jgi:hypothetical protein